MELVTGAGVLLLLFLLTALSFKLHKARGQLPPGPTPWLFLGNLLQKEVLPLHKTYPKLFEKYGSVFTIWLGPKPVVVLCGYDAVKGALVDHAEAFGGRPPIALVEKVTDGYGLLSPDNEKWRELRRFTLSTLRNFGMGRKPMAERMQEEANCLVEVLAAKQAKVHQEIDEVVGVNRAPGVEDRVKMNYTNAFTHEMLRYQLGSSEAFPRLTTQDVDFKGYTIPQGTIIVPLFISVHFDPACWETPEKFDPGHFLDAEGEFRKNDAYMAFSAGKRACPGEGLAKMELFLFIVTLLQNFTFQLVANPNEVDVDTLFSACRGERKHCLLRAIRRKNVK
ncbi:cytochrome P450 2B4-like [Podarcis muralis]